MSNELIKDHITAVKDYEADVSSVCLSSSLSFQITKLQKSTDWQNKAYAMLKPWSHELSIQEPCFMFRNGTTRSRDNSETCARLIPIFFKKTLRCVETGIETPINFDLIVVSRVWSVTILLLKSSSSESFLIPVPFSDKWKRLKASWTNVSPAPWCEQP